MNQFFRAANSLQPPIVRLLRFLLTPSRALLVFTVSLFTTFAGVAQTAVRFDGVDDYIRLQNPSTATSFTLEARIKTSVASATGTFAYEGNGIMGVDLAGTSGDYSFTILNNKLAFFDGNANTSTFGTTNVVDGMWHNVAVVRTGSAGGTIIFYVDGVQDGTAGTAGTAAFSSANDMHIGENLSHYLNGYLDEIRIWNTARTAAQVLTYMNANLNGNETGLSEYLRLNDGTVNSANAANSVISTPSQNSGSLISFTNTAATSVIGTSGWVFAPCPTTAPAAPTPVNYCIGAVASALTSPGTNLLWSTGGAQSGAAGGIVAMTTGYSFLEGRYPPSTDLTSFSTLKANVTLVSVDYTIQPNNSVTGLVLSLYNSSNVLIATSITNTTITAGSVPLQITNVFNFNIIDAGNYSIRASAGFGNSIGTDNPTSTLVEPTGTINITGYVGGGRFFNNFQFTVGSSATAPIPSTAAAGTTPYFVSQTANGCTSASSTINVVVSAPPSATISYTASPFCKSLATGQVPSFSGTAGGTYTSTAGIAIASTGSIIPSAYPAGTYVVTYSMAAAGGCAAKTATTSITVTAVPSISYAGSPYCSSRDTAMPTINAPGGGTFTSTPGGLVIDAASGIVNVSSSTANLILSLTGIAPIKTYTVTYTVPAAGGCAAPKANIIITTQPFAKGFFPLSPYCALIGSGTASPDLAVSMAVGKMGTITSDPGIIFSNPGAAVIDLTNSALGMHTITYFVAAAGGCGDYTASAPFDITAPTLANLSYEGSPFCDAATAIMTKTGTAGGTFTATGPAGFTINGTSGDLTFPNTVAIYTVTYKILGTPGCAQYTTSTTARVVTPGTWLGKTSSEWNDATNWPCGGVPTSTSVVTIPAGIINYPLVSTATATVNTLNILAGSLLTVSGAKLQIAGAINNAGRFDVSNGTIELNGTSGTQIIPVKAFINLTDSSVLNLVISNNVTFSGRQSITGTLSFGASIKTLTTGGFLNLKSSAFGTASVADITNGGINSGNVISGTTTIERFMPARRSWRLLTSPLTGTGFIFNSWQNAGVPAAGKGMLISGAGANPATNGLDISPLNNYSMKAFSAGALINITNTKNTNLDAYSAYFVFVRGDRNTANFNYPNTNTTTLSSTGNLRTGTQLIPTTSTYTLVGNPYASPVDFNLLQRAGLTKRFYTWDPTLNQVGGYVVLDDYNNDGIYTKFSSSIQTQVIQSGQAFFVQKDSSGNAAANITCNESSKSIFKSATGFRPVEIEKSMEITLNLLEADHSTTPADATIAEFSAGYNAWVDIQDAIKFTNTDETFSFTRNGTALAIERYPLVKANDTMFLKLIQATQRNYQFVISSKNMGQQNLSPFLEDSYTATSTPLSPDGSTVVDFAIDGNAASKIPGRFRVVFKKIQVLPVTYTAVKAILQGNNISVQWDVENQMNIQRYEVEKSLNGISFIKVNTQFPISTSAATANYNWLDVHATSAGNFYRIRNVDLDGAAGYSKIVKVTLAGSSDGISIYPNPVTGGKINLQLSNMPQGKYALRLLSSIGQELLTKEINHAGGNASETILLSKNISRGMYTLEILHPGGSKSTISVMNQ